MRRVRRGQELGEKKLRTFETGKRDKYVGKILQ